MIITEEYIRQLEEYHRFCFSEDLKKALINQLGEEPCPNEYSEEDIWELARKIIQSHRRNR